MQFSLKLVSASALALFIAGCQTYGTAESSSSNTSMETKPMSEMAMDDGKMMDDDKMDEDQMAEDAPMVGGAAMYPSKTIVENASQASNLTTLVAAVKQAQLVETLSSEGPFTVFAPTNAAFAKLPTATVNSLMMDENREQLQKVLTAHTIAGKISSSDLVSKIKMNPTGYSAQTVSGDTLTFYWMNDAVKIADENGGLATVTMADVNQSNGVVHVIDSVLVPK